MRKSLICLAGLLLLAAPAQATVFQASLHGSEEVPPTGSQATGFITVTLSDDFTTLLVDETFAGLISPATGNHIHCCSPPGANSTVALDFGSFFPNANSGSFTHLFNLTTDLSAGFVTAQGGVAAAHAAFVNGLFSGLTYANVHNTVFRGGEIRGQLLEVPEPAAATLLMGALLALPLMRRRKN